MIANSSEIVKVEIIQIIWASESKYEWQARNILWRFTKVAIFTH